MARFSTDFLGCKVSHADVQEIRERLLAEGHVEDANDADVAVISTCCVTREAVAKSRKAARQAARSGGARIPDGLRRNLSGSFDDLPSNVTVVALPSERTAAFVAGNVGAIGCVQAEARLDRVRAFVKVQDGCSFSLQVLRHPAGARSLAQSACGGGARRGPTPRAAGSP